MSAVSFNDNLYRAWPEMGGCGLKGFARTAFWSYARHDDGCRPGMWCIGLCPGRESDGFSDMTVGYVHCVVDDFGNLRRVQ